MSSRVLLAGLGENTGARESGGALKFKRDLLLDTSRNADSISSLRPQCIVRGYRLVSSRKLSLNSSTRARQLLFLSFVVGSRGSGDF